MMGVSAAAMHHLHFWSLASCLGADDCRSLYCLERLQLWLSPAMLHVSALQQEREGREYRPSNLHCILSDMLVLFEGC